MSVWIGKGVFLVECVVHKVDRPYEAILYAFFLTRSEEAQERRGGPSLPLANSRVLLPAPRQLTGRDIAVRRSAWVGVVRPPRLQTQSIRSGRKRVTIPHDDDKELGRRYNIRDWSVAKCGLGIALELSTKAAIVRSMSG